MQRRVYQRQIHSVDELKRRLIDVWLPDQWRGKLQAYRYVCAKDDTTSTACELTMLIFVHICYKLSISVTKKSLGPIYTKNYKF